MLIVHNFNGGTRSPTPQTGMIMLFDNALDRSSLTNAPQVASRMTFPHSWIEHSRQRQAKLPSRVLGRVQPGSEAAVLDMPDESDGAIYASTVSTRA